VHRFTVQQVHPAPPWASALHEAGTSKVASEGPSSSRSRLHPTGRPRRRRSRGYQHPLLQTGLPAGRFRARRFLRTRRRRRRPRARFPPAGRPGGGIRARRHMVRPIPALTAAQLCTVATVDVRPINNNFSRHSIPATPCAMAPRAVNHARQPHENLSELVLALPMARRPPCCRRLSAARLGWGPAVQTRHRCQPASASLHPRPRRRDFNRDRRSRPHRCATAERSGAIGHGLAMTAPGASGRGSGAGRSRWWPAQPGRGSCQLAPGVRDQLIAIAYANRHGSRKTAAEAWVKNLTGQRP